MSPEKLVHMANQIATFFETQPGSDQVARTAQHLKDFWDPRMVKQILEIAAGPDNALSPLARQAVAQLGEVAA